MKRLHESSLLALTLLSLLSLGSSPAFAAKRAQKPVQLSGVLNLNQATLTQLDLLPGVGETAAKRIVAHREKTPFTRAEELVKVKGFGKKRFDRLKPHLAISGPTTLRVLSGPGSPVRAAP